MLAEPEPPFEKALKAIETASRDVGDLQLRPKTMDSNVSKAGAQLPVHNVGAGQTWQGKTTPLKCYRCGGEHVARDCWFINEKCHTCGKKGHLKKMHKQFGKGVKRDKKQSAHHISESPVHLSSEEEVFTLHNLTEPKISKIDPITTKLNLNGNMVEFEVDTGCSGTIMSRTVYAKLWSAGSTPELQDCSLTLKTYTGERVPTLIAAEVTVQFKGQIKQLPVVVVAGPEPNLVGRAWIKELGMNCVLVNNVEQQMTLQELLRQNEDVFKEELGT